MIFRPHQFRLRIFRERDFRARGCFALLLLLLDSPLQGATEIRTEMDAHYAKLRRQSIEAEELFRRVTAPPQIPGGIADAARATAERENQKLAEAAQWWGGKRGHGVTCDKVR